MQLVKPAFMKALHPIPETPEHKGTEEKSQGHGGQMSTQSFFVPLLLLFSVPLCSGKLFDGQGQWLVWTDWRSIPLSA
jgi:hypothetical protein